MKPIILISLLALALAGCSDDSYIKNRATLSGPGQYVGTLPDGREVRRYLIENPVIHDHWLYVAGRDLTVNHDESSGKTTYNAVEAFIPAKP